MRLAHTQAMSSMSSILNILNILTLECLNLLAPNGLDFQTRTRASIIKLQYIQDCYSTSSGRVPSIYTRRAEGAHGGNRAHCARGAARRVVWCRRAG